MVKMRKRFRLVLGMLLAVGVIGGVMPGGHAAAATIVTDGADGFAFAVPDSWTQQAANDVNIAASYRASDPTGFFIVGVYPAVPGASLDESMGLTISQTAKVVANYTFLQAQSTMVGDEPGRQVIFSGTNQGVPYYGAQRIALHGDKLYVLTFGALPGDIDAFKAQVGVPLTTWRFL